jgi:Uma2 family endonuclease
MSAVLQDTHSAEDLLRLPDDGTRRELVLGELRTMALAGANHGYLAMQIAASLHRYVNEHGLGRVFAAETGFILARDPDTVRAPDVAFISRERLEQTGIPSGYWPGAPDLAVEVISPSDTYAEVEDKVCDWLEAGTRLVIVVNPRKQAVTVYRSAQQVRLLTGNEVLDGADVIPGWALPVSDIFA